MTYPDPGREPWAQTGGGSYPPQQPYWGAPQPGPPRRGRTGWIVAIAVVIVLAVAGVVTYRLVSHKSSPSASPSSGSSPAGPGVARQQVTVTISGQGPNFYPNDVTVDKQGNLYVAAVNEGVLRLAPGSQSPTRLPFSGVDFGVSAGVDDAGNVYLSDSPNQKGRVRKLTPSGQQNELPFTGLEQDPHLAVAPDGTVYVADGGNNRVLELPAGGSAQKVLPFTGLTEPYWVAVDGTGNVYVSDRGNSRVLMLSSGSATPTQLPLHVQGQQGVAVDSSGTVYVEGAQGVTALAKDSQQPTVLPVQGASSLYGIAVNAKGDIYVIDHDTWTIYELKVS